MPSAGTVLLITGLISLLIAAILIWIGIDTRNKEINKGESPNAGWWWIIVGNWILFLGILSLVLAITVPSVKSKPKGGTGTKTS
jgi:hypothetical protein